MSRLRESMRAYLVMRRNLGYKLHEHDGLLFDFASFMERRHASCITVQRSLLWAQKPKHVQPRQWARRLGVLRGFARYHSTVDPSTQIPPASLLSYRRRRPRPYLYTDEEIERLLRAALQTHPQSSIRPWTYFTLLGLLSVTGLRISEALNLQLEDVDLDECVLTIHGTKFGRSRLVPIHPTTRDVLLDYLRRRSRFLTGRSAAHFFVSTRGKGLRKPSIYGPFHALSRKVGLRASSASHGPRLHDFRHRVAVEALLRWYRAGADPERRLPILSTFLGHVRWSDTYWYLEQHPELMGLAVARLQNRWESAS
jgi:integrase/recombinase XerD